MFQNINPLAKSTAIMEILIMLLVAAIIGYLLGLLHSWLVCKARKVEVKGEVKKPVAIIENTVKDVVKDDLKKIEGVGPAIEKLLNAAGIFTFAQLADTSLEKIKEIIHAAGPQFQMHGGDTWAEQATLARDGKWEEFKKLTDELINGKRI